MTYITADTLFNQAAKIKPPSTLDSIKIIKEDITFNIYGVLHGISGGTNADYRQFVNDSIANAPGLKLGEKGMTHLYSNLDGELYDWLAVPYKDIVKLTLSMYANPIRLAKFIRILLSEKLKKTDKFPTSVSTSNLGGSRYFHLLDPFERRKLAGFPDALTYLHINLDRRTKKESNFKLPTVFDSDWEWLNWIEPYANLPLRSIFMIEYAREIAHLTKSSEISLFIGEIHNTDIATYLNLDENSELFKNPVIIDTISAAKISAYLTYSKRKQNGYSSYILGILSAMSILFAGYASFIIALKRYFF